MIRLILFLLIVMVFALLFSWVAENPGTVYIQWEWLAVKLGRPGEEAGIPITVALTILIGLIVIAIFIWSIVKNILGIPSLLSGLVENRRRERGYRALSQGLIAASSGDIDTARSRTKESGKLLGKDPLVALLGTQTALLEGKRDEARNNFQLMLSDENTRMVALRGLFLEAEHQGQSEAARYYAEEAAKQAPSLPWAGRAKLRYEATNGDWDAAIQTLEANRSAGLVEKDTARRQRAVLLTAKAITHEQASPENARKLAKEAHKLVKSLVPAATIYARAASRLGDFRSAASVIEACWKQAPHPDLAEAYATVRTGDSVQDKLKRAKKLASLKPDHPESNIAVAIAAIDAKAWKAAREALASVLVKHPTERACLLMADIEEGQHGDHGRMRDWLSRAVHAPADKVWTADGHVSREWLPVSPVTGEIDAFEWRVPVARLGETDSPIFLTMDELKEASGSFVRPVSSNFENDPDIIEVAAAEPQNNDPVEKPTIDNTNLPDADQETTADDTKPYPPTTNADAVDKKEKTLSTDQILTADIPVNDFEPAEDKDFPFSRRPDDPGVHSDKQPAKKGFIFF